MIRYYKNTKDVSVTINLPQDTAGFIAPPGTEFKVDEEKNNVYAKFVWEEDKKGWPIEIRLDNAGQWIVTIDYPWAILKIGECEEFTDNLSAGGV